MVTVRPPDDQLWLVGVLDQPKRDDTGWHAKPNRVAIVDITTLRAKLTFATGKGIQAAPGALGMSLQTPRTLTDADEQLLRVACGDAGATPSAPQTPPAAPALLRVRLPHGVVEIEGGAGDRILAYSVKEGPATSPALGELDPVPSAAQFAPGSHLKLALPAHPPVKAFSAKVVFRPLAAAGPRMNLMEGQSIPFAMGLGREDGKYYFGAAIADRNGAWVGVTARSLPIPIGEWAVARLTFDGSRLRVSVTLAPTATDSERQAEGDVSVDGISSFGERAVWIGTWVNLSRDPFLGQIAAARLSSEVPRAAVPREEASSRRPAEERKQREGAIQTLEQAIDFIHHARPWTRSSHRPPKMPDDLPDGLVLLYEQLGDPCLWRLGRRRNEHTTQSIFHGALFAAQDLIYPLDSLTRVGATIEFASENQNNWVWRTAAGRGDGQVMSNYDPTSEETEPPFSLVTHSLRDFLVTFCLHAAVVSSKATRWPKTIRPIGEAIPGATPLWLDAPYQSADAKLSVYEMKGTGTMIVGGIFEGYLVGTEDPDLGFAGIPTSLDEPGGRPG